MNIKSRHFNYRSISSGGLQNVTTWTWGDDKCISVEIDTCKEVTGNIFETEEICASNTCI